MIQRLSFLLVFFISNIIAHAQYNTLIMDRFVDRTKFIDNSVLLHWGHYNDTVSAFVRNSKADNTGLTFSALKLNDTAILYTNYHNTAIRSLKAATCIDYVFPVFNRTLDTMKIQFDMLWPTVAGSGEVGRVNIILLHSYPNGGAKFGEIDSLTHIHPFARPAYNVRLRNSVTVTNKGFILYGGGNEELRRMYIHDEINKVYKHWLPGAVPASATNVGPFTYPDSISSKDYTTTVASATNWKHFTWLITPEKIFFYHRNSSNS